MNKPTRLWLHPPLLPNPILDDIFHYPISCKWRMPFSLLKCYDRVIERNYSPVTLQRWLHEACGFIKKTSGVMERESEYFHSVRVYFAGRLEQIFRDGGESGCWGGNGGSQQAEGCSHIHHHLFVYIETTDHLETEQSSRIRRSTSGRAVLIRNKCWNGFCTKDDVNFTFGSTWNGCCIMTDSTMEHC